MPLFVLRLHLPFSLIKPSPYCGRLLSGFEPVVCPSPPTFRPATERLPTVNGFFFPVVSYLPLSQVDSQIFPLCSSELAAITFQLQDSLPLTYCSFPSGHTMSSLPLSSCIRPHVCRTLTFRNPYFSIRSPPRSSPLKRQIFLPLF